MKLARSNFKNALQFCRNNELKLRKAKLLSKFHSGSKSNFWHEVRNMDATNNNSGQCIDGMSNPDAAVKVFERKFMQVLNDPECQMSYTSAVPVLDRALKFNFCCNDVDAALQNLKDGLGWDGIYTNHLKYSGPVFLNFLTKLYNKMMSHSYVPYAMLKGEIRPVLKNGKVSKSSSDNYRPVMNSSVLLKTLEYLILPVLRQNLTLSSRQFGFRPSTNCQSAVATVHEIIKTYTDNNSNVHCAMLDLSKAFDRINFDILFMKLRETELPTMIIRLLEYMLRNDFVNVSFNGCKVSDWLIDNGARQGRNFSPLMFNFYIYYLIETVLQKRKVLITVHAAGIYSG